jgi:bifunctional ADP-heptose synthase (sugar kinase/adenylyltransferase)
MIIKVDPAKVQEQKKAARIAELQQLLRDTDYVVLSDYDKDKPDVLLQRQAWRDEIRALENTQ